MDYPDLHQILEGKIDRKKPQVEAKLGALIRHFRISQKYIDKVDEKKDAIAEFRSDKQDYPILAEIIDRRHKLSDLLVKLQAKQGHIKDDSEIYERHIQAIQDWRRDMDLLLNFNPLTDQKDQVDRGNFKLSDKKIWREPASTFKVFQQLFSPEDARVSPKVRGKFGGVHPDALPIDSCIVDPGNISDSMLRKLGIFDMPDGLSEVQRMVVRSQLTPALKDLFNHVQSIRPTLDKKTGNYRILFVSDYPDPDQDGKIIANFSFARGDFPRDHKIAHVFSDLYDVDRQKDHVNKGVWLEKEELKMSAVRIKAIHSRVLSIRATDPDDEKEKVKTQAREDLQSEVVLLKAAVNDHKQNAHQTLKLIDNLQDSLGRDNPTVVCVRLIQVVENLESRLDQTDEIGKFTSEDAMDLKNLQQDQEIIFTGSLEELLAMGTRLSEAKGSRKKTDKLMRDVIDPLESFRNRLEKAKVRPFNVYARLIEQKILQVQEGIADRTFTKAVTPAIQSYVIAKLFEVHKTLKTILHSISLPRDETEVVGLESLILKMEHLHEVVSGREVFPDIKVGYFEVYEDVEKRISDMLNELREAQDSDLTKAEKFKVYQTLKLQLKEFDFEAILSQLD